ncbi:MULTISPECIES: 16S rRNA (cytosine(967)-C(5))-methyltransferase RsmB [unclassified Fusibacter]|uniref:16S rRNA (cytosine(967)-C(5))-methyltransferase RsmB n=1 Tax=unclassified Fusibacter TaxID=2624464 RepID=UPI0013E9272A|nr:MULTISPECIES: 16S rRNA (cytosine(967)-C(5))-methyltransferase RsmB [unclassified Fusibacter]MCK8058055.1 16S rRNA (cytosine(967)-C(5))-methyltransferase RsmB [Fusibacter sp. A2]NPE20637.1 16S rRNA (cytosine(967)-C(5))-methyltransferase RsmB [Fusibacter sp. A1]
MQNRDIKWIVKAIKKIMGDEAYSNIVVNQMITEAGLDAQDARMLRKVVYGVIENWMLLEYTLSHYAKKRMKPEVKYLLMAALYELLYLDGRKDHAVVNRYVGAAKKQYSFASGFINAVLRNALREPVELPEAPVAHALSIRYSHPEWLVRRWIENFGEEETRKLLEADLSQKPLTLRVDTLKESTSSVIEKLRKHGVDCMRHEYVEHAIIVKSLGNNRLEQLQCFVDGTVFVQDVSSMLVGMAASVEKGMRVLDLCSAPGGKSTDIASRLQGTGEVVACDIHPHKLELVKENKDRLKLDNMTLRVQDALKLRQEDVGSYDVVLLDAPCSGMGIIGRKPEIKLRKSIEDIEGLVEVQAQMLKVASQYVKSGGILLYSTCTIEREENEDQIERFLQDNHGFEIENLGVDFSFACEPTDSFVSLRQSSGWSDGFFIAKLKKN